MTTKCSEGGFGTTCQIKALRRLEIPQDLQKKFGFKQLGEGDGPVKQAIDWNRLETAHLMRSPMNAQRLLASLERALSAEGEPATPEKLRKELGLEG